jgi:hypothetical protein
MGPSKYAQLGYQITTKIIPFIKINVQLMNIQRHECKAPEGAPDAGNPLWVVEAGQRSSQGCSMFRNCTLIFDKWYYLAI